MSAAREYRIQHQTAILNGFIGVLSVPNVAADPAGLRQNADNLVTMLRERQFWDGIETMASLLYMQ